MSDLPRPWRILIVDDCREDRLEVKAALLRGSTRRYEFIEAETGIAGLKLCDRQRMPDCIVLDHGLPDMDAVELLRELRGNGPVPAVPVVIMTGSAEGGISREVLRAGAQDFVGKAWLTPESMTRALENAIDRHETARQLLRHAERQTVLLDLTRMMLSSTLDETAMVAELYGRIAESIGTEFCLFYTPRADGDLELKWQKGLTDEQAAPARQLSPMQSFCGIAAQTLMPLVADEDRIERDPRGAFARALGVRACVCHPLLASDRTLIGTFSVGRRSSRPFSLDEVAFLETICHSLVVFFERRRAELALQQNERQLQSITDNTPQILARFDRNKRYVFVNAAVKRATGLPPTAFLGKTNRELWMPSELCDQWDATLERVFSTGQTETTKYTFHAPDGPRRYESQYVPEFSISGDVEYVLQVTRDVTDAWRTTVELTRTKELAEAANEAKDRFLAILSHELRTPLAPVRLTVSSWERAKEKLPPELRRDMAMVRRNIDLECRLIDDMLDLNRITRGKLELHCATIDLHEEIRHSIRTVEEEAAAKQIVLSFDADAEACEIVGDAARIQQVLWNLLKNAVKFTPPGGSVHVRSSNPSSHRIRVEVRDTGAGIEPEVIGSIFNAFEQGGAQVTRQFGGLGLGLSISKALVEMHGGELTAMSGGKGQGATFSLTLGVAAPEELAARDRGMGSVTASAAPAKGGSRALRILLVEDHPDTARVMARLLSALGYDMRTAGSVQEGLAAAEASSFDLIISDLGLPDGSGHDLMRQLTMRGPVKGIALTGFGMEEDVRRGRDAGFVAHLTKPVNLEQLEVTIQRVAGHGSMGTGKMKVT